MERYGNADLIRDILERQGLIWLLEGLAPDESQEQRPRQDADAGLMQNGSRTNSVKQEGAKGQNIITENDADHVYTINSGPGASSGTFGCENEVSYPLPILQLRELANRQYAAQQQALRDCFIAKQVSQDFLTCYHRNAYQPLSANPSRTQKVNGWTCVTTRAAPNPSPIPELISKSFSAPNMRYKAASSQTDGPCYEESKCPPAFDDTDLQEIESMKTEPKSDVSTAVTRKIIEAAASKLVESFKDWGKRENHHHHHHQYKENRQIQHSDQLQGDKQQEISPNPEASHISQKFSPSPVSSTELVDTLSDDATLVSSYRSTIGRILSKNAHKKPESYRTIQQDLNETPLAPTQHSPPPERCIVEACLIIHLGSRNRAKTSKARHEAKGTIKQRNEQQRNKVRKGRPKTNDSGTRNDYVRVKYELVNLPCYDDPDGVMPDDDV